MPDPEPIHRREHQRAQTQPPGLGLQPFAQLLQPLRDQLAQRILALTQLRAVQLVQIQTFQRRQLRRLLPELVGHAPIPQPLGERAAQIVDRLLRHVADDLPQILPRVEHLVALPVDHIALPIDHVVVVDQMLANVEVVGLHLQLRLLQRLAHHPRFERCAVLQPRPLQHPRQPVGREALHHPVLERDVETRRTGIPLPPRTTAQLIIDPPRLVPLRADHRQPARLRHARAELDVGAPPSHVRRDRHRPRLARPRDDLRLPLVLLRVEHLVPNAPLAQHLREPLRSLHRRRAHQHRTPQLLQIPDLLDHRVELRLLRAEHEIRLIVPHHLPVRRRHHHLQRVNLVQLLRLRLRRARHPRQLVVHPEIVLVGDRRQRHRLPLHAHPLLRLNRLVQPLRVAPPVHHPPRELVDNHHLALPHHIVPIPLVDELRLQRRIEKPRQPRVLPLEQVVDPQQLLNSRDPLLGQRHRPRLRLRREILLNPQTAHQIGEHSVSIERLLRLPADDQRRPRLVDQNVVHLIDDRVSQRALHLLLRIQHHVVPQIVEAELIVRPVGDVRAVSLPPRAGPQHPQIAQLAPTLPLFRIQLRIVLLLRRVLHRRVEEKRRAVLQHPHREPQRVVNRPHPLRVALRQIVVHRHQMRPIALQRIQIERQRRHQRLPLARPHLRNLALVQHHPAQQLHIVVAHLHTPTRRLPHRRKRLRQNVVQRRPILQPPHKLRRQRAQLIIAQPLRPPLPLIHRFHRGPQPLNLARMRVPEHPPHAAQQRHQPIPPKQRPIQARR